MNESAFQALNDRLSAVTHIQTHQDYAYMRLHCCFFYEQLLGDLTITIPLNISWSTSRSR